MRQMESRRAPVVQTPVVKARDSGICKAGTEFDSLLWGLMPQMTSRRAFLRWCLVPGATSGVMMVSGELWAQGSRDDQAELQALLQRGPVRLQSHRVYRLRRPLELASGASIIGDPSSVVSPEGNFPAIVVSGSDVELNGFSIRGRPEQFRSSGAHGIFVDWRRRAGGNVHLANVIVESVAGSGIIALASPHTRSTGLSVADCQIRRTGAHGIIAQDYIDDVAIERNEVEATSLIVPDRPGITASRHGRRVIIRHNRCRGVPGIGGKSVHGISLDMCEDADCSSNEVSGWTNGYGIEAAGVHGGTIASNSIAACRYGIGIPGIGDGFTSRDLLIEQNAIRNSIEAGIFSFVSNGDGMTEHRDVVLRSNRIQGVSGTGIGIGVYLTDIDGLVIDDIDVSGSRHSGVFIVDCPDHKLKGIKSHDNNLGADPRHAGLSILWRKVPPARRGLNEVGANLVEHNGGHNLAIFH